MNDYEIDQMTKNLDANHQQLIKDIKKKKEDIQNLVNTCQDIEAMLIDILDDKVNTTFTESEIDDHKHKLANILEDNGVYEMVRNRERSDYYE